VGFVLGVNLLVAVNSRGILVPQDWWIWEQLPERLQSGTLYELSPDYRWVWSPIAAGLLAWVVVPLGYSVWFALHLAVLPFLGSSTAVLLVVLSLPFWIDTVVGNAVVFVVVAGAAALRGSWVGTLLYGALFFLMPRPLQVPLLLWLVWRRPESRVAFLLMALVTLGVTITTGYLGEWTRILTSQAEERAPIGANLSPTRWVGLAWLVLGLPIAGWLTIKGRVGLAGLAMSPYLLPQYLLTLVWEFDDVRRGRRRIHSREIESHAALAHRRSRAGHE